MADYPIIRRAIEAAGESGVSRSSSVSQRYPLIASAVGRTFDSENEDEQPRGFQWGRRTFMGGVRGLASALEPLQAPKDVFDALVAGALDPETTITERLKRLDPVAYVPFGRAPTRAADGAEILELMGVEDPRARKWGGLVWDLAADPLIAGSYLRLGGTLLRSRQLVNIGDRIDRALSLSGVNRGLNRVIPGKKWVDRRTQEALNTFLNQPVAWGSDLKGSRRWGDLFQSRTAALRTQFGDVRNPETGMFEGVGTELYRIEQLTRQRARNAAEKGLDLVEEGQRQVLGDLSGGWLKKAMNIISRGRRNADQVLENMNLPAGVRDTIYSQAYDVVDRAGLAARAGVTNMSTRQERLIMAARGRVRKSALETGLTADQANEAVRRLDAFVEKITQADALFGYHLSGHEYISKLFMRRMNAVGLSDNDAIRMWSEVQQRGMAGEDIYALTDIGRINIESKFSGKYKTLGNLLEEETTLRGLNLGTYFKNLHEGHMRRAYGLFQDKRSFDNFIKNMESGRVIPSNIIDDAALKRSFGSDTAEYRAIRRYMDNLEPTPESYTARTRRTRRGGVARPVGEEMQRGVVLRQRGMIEAVRDELVLKGVGQREASRRAHEGVMNLVKEIQAPGSPLRGMIDEVIELSKKWEQHPTQDVRFGMGRAMFREREELSRETLEAFGEFAIPQVGLREQAQAVATQTAWSDYMSEVYDLAQREGLIAKGKFQNANGTRYVPMPAQTDWVGPFAGQYVHPVLKKEIIRSMQERASGTMGGRLRTLVTGGYLASPNVITANIFGGIYTSALIGISPAAMAREMAESFREFRASSQNPNITYQALDDLKQYISVNDTTLIDANVDQGLRMIRGAEDLGPSGVAGAFDTLTREIQQHLLDRPLGQSWAGLDGFQFVENWMKVSAFQARRRQLAFRRGVDMAEFKKFRPDRSPAAHAIDREAAEAARVAVFDYSEIPDSLRFLRDSGLVLFPGFTYFLTARTVRSFFERPQPLAVADRLSDAVNNVSMDEELKQSVWARLPEWLQEEQGVVLPFSTWTDEDGNTRRSVIPLNQLIPTESFAGNPWGESLASGGIYKPFVELAAASFITEGEAPFSAKYGQRVFERDRPVHQKVAQGLGFLANNLAPGLTRKVAGYTPGEGFSGLGPTAWQALTDSAVPMEGPLADTIYSVWEVQNRKAKRRLLDEAIATTIRSPQVITSGGPLDSWRRRWDSAKFELDEEINALRQRRERAVLRGDRVSAERLTVQMNEIRQDFYRRMRPYVEAIRQEGQ